MALLVDAAAAGARYGLCLEPYAQAFDKTNSLLTPKAAGLTASPFLDL